MTPTKSYQCDEALREKLIAYRKEHNLTISELARQMGRCDPTRMSKYLSGKPDVNPSAMEQRARDLLRAASRRKVAEVPFFATDVVNGFNRALEQIRVTNDLGLITGDAGIGKTESIKAYMKSNQSAILITCSEWAGTGQTLTNLLCNEIDVSDWNGKTKKSEWLIKTLTGTNWPIIVDQAQLLKKSGREFIVNLWDATRCPVCMVGNPEIWTQFKANDQHASRIGLWEKLTLKDTKNAAEHMIDAILGGNQDPALYDLASDISARRGHLRTLYKQLLLTRDLYNVPAFQERGGTLLQAFEIAGRKLIR